MSWAEGNIELVFYIYNGERVTRLARSLTLNDAFDVVHIYNVRKYNWIGALQTSHYYIDEKCVQPKWVEVDWGLFIWDLSKLTREYKIEVYELDGGKDETKTVTEEFSYSGNIKVDQSIGVTPNKVVNIKVGSEAGGAISKKENKTYSYTYKYNDNLLGETYVDYRDNIILSKGNGKSKMHIYNCGDVDLMIIPMYN